MNTTSLRMQAIHYYLHHLPMAMPPHSYRHLNGHANISTTFSVPPTTKVGSPESLGIWQPPSIYPMSLSTSPQYVVFFRLNLPDQSDRTYKSDFLKGSVLFHFFFMCFVLLYIPPTLFHTPFLFPLLFSLSFSFPLSFLLSSRPCSLSHRLWNIDPLLSMWRLGR